MTVTTINRSNPVENTPVAAAVVRNNFVRAANDIDALWSALAAIAPLVGVNSFNGRQGTVVLLKADVTSALGYDPGVKMGNFQWINPTDTSSDPIVLIPYAEYAFTISRLNALATSAGSAGLTISINGVPVTGLNALAVTTIAQNPIATALNTVSVGDRVTLALSGTLGAKNLIFSMLGQL